MARSFIMLLVSLLWSLPVHGQEAVEGPLVQQLNSAYAAGGEAEAAGLAAAWGLKVRPGRDGVRLPVILEPRGGLPAAALAGPLLDVTGARVDGVSDSYMRVLVPVGALRHLARHPDVARVRTPIPAKEMEGFGAKVSESVGLTGAAEMQAAGIAGAGIKVAVVDLGFIGLTDAIAAGELPPDTHRVKGNVEGASIEVDTEHGVGVSEHVLDMAPGVELYCIYVEDEVDLENAAAYISQNGIRIANHSVGWVNASYYDDTGPIAGIINQSRDEDGVFWAVAAGNDAEAHWRGGWSDSDGDGVLAFAGNDETMGLYASSSSVGYIFLNWDQYGNSVTDLDLYVLNKNGSVVGKSESWQNGPQDPAEAVAFNWLLSQAPYSAVVQHYSGPTAGLDMTLFSFYNDFEHPVAACSLMEPADAHGACSVAAIWFGDWELADPPPEPFSSQGPTNDGRLKPDIASPDGTTSWAYGDQASYGTSFSSPTVAGAAALLLEEDPALSPVALAALLADLAEDIGVPGPDVVFGAGKLHVESVGCTGDADCDDGVPCNGSESCDVPSGTCLAGTPVDCSHLDGPCTAGVCLEVSGLCEAQPANEGSACDDGLFCTAGDTCQSGACVAGPALDCSAFDGPCTVGSCDEDSDQCEAQPANEGGACEDGLFCTGGDVCQAGACVAGPAMDCSAFDGQCTMGVCNEDADACEAQPANEGVGCEDGDLCTSDESCQAGVCIGGIAVDCSYLDGTCTAGVCNPLSGACEEQSANEGGACEDGLFCTAGDTCQSGACVAGPAMDCSAFDGPCTVGSCDEDSDQCEAQPANEGGACEDGLFCTGGDVCQAGACVAGPAMDCSAFDGQCTMGVCNEDADACEAQPANEGVGCEDGDLCTSDESCQAGVCIGGIAVDCSYLDGPCATGYCDAVTGLCESDTAEDGTPCDDGFFCNGTESCSGGLCVAGSPVDCDDGISCTFDSCDEAGVECVNSPDDALCDDGLYCNGAELCDGVAGCQAGSAPDCDDGIGCTVDTCDEAGEQCLNAAEDGLCDDGLYCNGAEYCDAVNDCWSDAVPCPGQGCDEALDQCLVGGPPYAQTGVATSGTDWVAVPLDRSYQSMVVVCTPAYGAASPPAVVRIRNAAGAGFEMLVQSATKTPAVLAGIPVHFLVVEEGVYNAAEHGVKMEAARFLSTVTDSKTSWVGEGRAYGQSYGAPAVVGQVMSFNDPSWSVFWSRNEDSRSLPPDATLRVGKHVGEDGDTTRGDELIGYIVIESGSGSMASGSGSLGYLAALGPDAVEGVGDSPPYAYALTGLTNVTAAVASQAAMSSNNGGWAVLYGASPVSASAIELAIDEDQLKDSERSHTSERVAYIVLAEAAAGCSEAADCDDGNGCTDDLCLEGGQCQHLFNQAPCDDGDECTLGDACSEGICSGTPDPSCAGCGDGICAGGGLGEDCATCPADCACIGKNCKNGCCGNGSCDKSESSLSCPVDCL